MTPHWPMRTGRHAVAAIASIVAIALLLATAGARAAGEVHGASDAFAAQGVAIAWAVRRGATEESTFVVVRIASPGRFTRVAVDGIDPFTSARKPLVSAQPLAGETDIRLPRAQFADYPRTEFRFFDASSGADAAPALVVYYAGVPDTTPEFNSDSAIAAYLSDRVARLRSSERGAPNTR